MKTYCINYNLSNPGRDYAGLINRIKSFGHGWCHPGGSHWFINTDLSCAQIRAHLKPALDENDQLLVHSVGDDWASTNMSKKVNDWLLSNWHSACVVN